MLTFVTVVMLISLIGGFICVMYVVKSRGIPFVAKQDKWSIGIYLGENPFNFIPPKETMNPVLTANDVTDVPAKFVADPFMLKEGNTWYMFFEVLNSLTKQGDIGLATSNDGLHWTYKKIVLDEPFHLSYPHVFKWDNEYYMIPEAHQTSSVRLYKAINFPTKWAFVKTLFSGTDYLDPTIFHYSDKWWIFTGTNRKKNDTLHLCYSDNIMGTWFEHPDSPVIKGDASKARPGGRVLIFDGRIIRYAQDVTPTYGTQLRAFEIDILTPTSYKEHELDKSPVLKASGIGWNRDGMHNIDSHQIDKDRWIACVDGNRCKLVLKFNHEQFS